MAGGVVQAIRSPTSSRIGTALRGHKLLSPKSAELVTTGKVVMGPAGQYAYGFGDFTAGGHRHVGHNGGAPGVSADFRDYAPLVRPGGLIAFHDIVDGPEENVGGVPRFWREIKGRYRHEELVKSWKQGGYGIGVISL